MSLTVRLEQRTSTSYLRPRPPSDRDRDRDRDRDLDPDPDPRPASPTSREPRRTRRSYRPQRSPLVLHRAGATLGAVPGSTPPDDAPLSFATRLWFAWLCLFRVLFDGRFAARLWGVREAPKLGPAVPRPALAAPSPTPALQFLSLLQREGRIVDFLQQDITGFPDADVGAAARVVHAGCRKALRAHAQIEPVFHEKEGARVELAAGFDAGEVKLVGDVRGEPPYAGVLRHRGWRATRFELPQIVGGGDVKVLAPAEVELG